MEKRCFPGLATYFYLKRTYSEMRGTMLREKFDIVNLIANLSCPRFYFSNLPRVSRTVISREPRLKTFHSRFKGCHGRTSVSITTMRFLSAGSRHSRRRGGTSVSAGAHYASPRTYVRVRTSAVHLRPARASASVYRAYRPRRERRDRNVDCLDNAAEKTRTLDPAIIGPGRSLS